jgi:hypothetical protein
MANGMNPFEQYLENPGGAWGSLVLQEMPRAAYLSSPTGKDFAKGSPRKQRYFQQAYQDVYSDYLGNIGSALRTGQTPTTFMDFMKTNPWTTRYSQMTPRQRGTTGSFSNPRTRFIYY